MIFQTVSFFIIAVVALFLIILAILNRDDNDVEIFLSVIAICVTVVIFISPNKITTLLESDYDIYKIVEETDCKVTTESLSNSETIDYIEFKEYILNRKKIILHTNSVDVYIPTEFTKYKK